MIFSTVKEIFVAQHRVDFRKSFDGLLAEARRLMLNPYDGECVVFVSRCKRRIKMLFGDSHRLWIIQCRFEGDAIKTRFRFLVDPCFVQITRAELMMLLEGADYQVDKRPRGWAPTG